MIDSLGRQRNHEFFAICERLRLSDEVLAEITGKKRPAPIRRWRTNAGYIPENVLRDLKKWAEKQSAHPEPSMINIPAKLGKLDQAPATCLEHGGGLDCTESYLPIISLF